MCLSLAPHLLGIHNMSATFDVVECDSPVHVGQLSVTYCESSLRGAELK